MGKKYLKKCPSSLPVGEMQTKTALRFYLASVRMAKIKMIHNKGWGWGARSLVHCWWEGESSGKNPHAKHKYTMAQIYHSLVHAQRTTPQTTDIGSVVFIAALFTQPEKREHPRVPQWRTYALWKTS